MRNRRVKDPDTEWRSTAEGRWILRRLSHREREVRQLGETLGEEQNERQKKGCLAIAWGLSTPLQY